MLNILFQKVRVWEVKSFWDVLVFFLSEWREHRTGIRNVSGLFHLDEDSALQSLHQVLFFYFHLHPSSSVRIRPMQQKCFDYTVTTRYEEKSISSRFFFSFTEGTRGNRRRWSTATRPPGCPSPASDTPCPPCPGKAELHWSPPHESRLCPPRRQKWPVSHSASGSPGPSRAQDKQSATGTEQKTASCIVNISDFINYSSLLLARFNILFSAACWAADKFDLVFL